MKNKTFFLLLISLFLFAAQTTAQRFKGGLILGLTASQIDGDNSVGYNKPGLNAGGRVLVNLSRRFDVSMEMLFAQRGSQSELLKDQYTINFFSQTFNYVEVPVQVHLRDWFSEDDEGAYSKVSVNAGFSYSRFMGARFEDDLNALATVEPFLHKNDFNYLIGASFYASRHFGFTVRAVRGIGVVYNPNEWDMPPFKDAWYSHSLYFQLVYMF